MKWNSPLFPNFRINAIDAQFHDGVFESSEPHVIAAMAAYEGTYGIERIGSGYTPPADPFDVAVAQRIDDQASETAKRLRAAFVPLHMTTPSATAGVDAAIFATKLAAAQAVVASGGRAEITFQSGPYLLPGGLPFVEGVSYRGVPPVLEPQNAGAGYMPDAEATFIGGTVLRGDGTGQAFHGNITAAGSAVDGVFSTTQIAGVHIYGFGIENYVDGLRAGAANVMGLVFGSIDEIYVRNCTGWGVRMVNFQHVDIGVIRAWDCTNGIYLGSDVPFGTLIPGNSQARELFVKVKHAGGGLNKNRGIVLGSKDMVGADLGGMDVDKLQVNAFNRPETSVTATFTSGSADIAVPDGSIFTVGMPVQFTAAGNGVTANNIYVIRAISGNNIQVALQAKSGSVVTASGSGGLTMKTRGFPNLELYDFRSSQLHDIDVEGQSTVGVYAENVEQVNLFVATVPETCLVELVGRNSPKTRWFNSYGGAKTDFDAVTASQSQFFGPRNATYGRLMQGLYEDVLLGTQGFNVSGGNQADSRPDLQVRAQGFLYPARSGTGEHVWVRDTSATLDGNNCGLVVVTGTNSPTFTLPTISTATVPGTSEVGMWFNICNTGTGTVTVTASGSQNFNRNGAKTTLTVAAGQSLKVVACEDISQMYWVAIPGTLA